MTLTLNVGLTAEELVLVAQGETITFGALPGASLLVSVSLRSTPPQGGQQSAGPSGPQPAPVPRSSLDPSPPLRREHTAEEDAEALRIAEESLERTRAEMGYADSGHITPDD